MNPTDLVYPIVKGQLPDGSYISQTAEGLTIRDHIAIQAMQGLLNGIELNGEYTATNIAEDSYSIADSMIAQSNKPGGANESD